ncbi:MAG: hypothetical protein ACYTEQ_25270 [Planctomycetota bacterium]|jgi:hypothetical protein
MKYVKLIPARREFKWHILGEPWAVNPCWGRAKCGRKLTRFSLVTDVEPDFLISICRACLKRTNLMTDDDRRKSLLMDPKAFIDHIEINGVELELTPHQKALMEHIKAGDVVELRVGGRMSGRTSFLVWKVSNSGGIDK